MGVKVFKKACSYSYRGPDLATASDGRNKLSDS